MSSIEPGLKNSVTKHVDESHLANTWGSGLAPVLATPVLVAFCEECARLAVDPLLPAGQQTVGTWISVRHLAPTPLGLDVTVRSELKDVDDRCLRFVIEVWDTVERVAEAEHERFIIDTDRFEQRVAQKTQRAQEV